MVGRNRAWGYLNRLLHVIHEMVKETDEAFTLPEDVDFVCGVGIFRKKKR